MQYRQPVASCSSSSDAARNYTFYMFYTDKSNGQSKGEILSNQNQ